MDALYIRKVLDGDSEAFRYFLKEYKHMAFTIALAVVKDEFTAEEVVQNAFLKAFRNLDKFHQQAKFSTWFYRIVTNEALMMHKKQKRDIVDLIPEYEEELLDESAILTMQQEEQQHLVNEALKQLSSKEALALRLFYLEEESVKSVGEITGWTTADVKTTMHRARKNLQGVLNQLLNRSLKV
ncbi:RNA polymerase sigma factor [Mucilaginibacter myungsuensis]|uniref:RNA polymerase sigma factor n=1 Tax=Mucilaginibacter myungsuensis TaxID=649104 RepID=A0A929PZ65_9SPHI|nr:sigma-70 family RNA polymerase sigma factor [Mucilaginibacter myungsuensis]MBE9664087.1 sigma-70 family RNA polymerase sigma factor [Mucilaginibacter myungsuensis]MDN3601266.1 sigma-70 family RNA polymerase sigma factor [Mucilaginibacter myungsuensis]